MKQSLNPGFAPLASVVLSVFCAVGAVGAWMTGNSFVFAFVAMFAAIGGLASAMTFARFRAAHAAMTAMTVEAEDLVRGEGERLQAGPPILRDALNAKLVAERRKAEHLEERLGALDQTLADHVSAASALDTVVARVRCDADGTIAEVSDAAAVVLGIGAEGVEAVHADTVFGKAFWETVTRDGTIEAWELPNKETKFDIARAMIANGDHGTDGCVITFHDVTERAAQTETAASYASAFASAPSALVMLDSAGRVVDINSACKNLIDDDPSLTERFPSLSEPGAFFAWESIFGDAPLTSEKASNTAVIGARRYAFDAQASDAATPGFGGSIVRITETTSAWTQSAIADSASSALATVIMGTDGIVSWANDKFLQTAEFTKDSIVGAHARVFQGLNGLSADQWATLKKGQSVVGRFQTQTGSGEELWFDGWYTPVTDDSGAVEAIVFAASDATTTVQEERDAAVYADAFASHQIDMRVGTNGTFVGEPTGLENLLGIQINSTANLLTVVPELSDAWTSAREGILTQTQFMGSEGQAFDALLVPLTDDRGQIGEIAVSLRRSAMGGAALEDVTLGADAFAQASGPAVIVDQTLTIKQMNQSAVAWFDAQRGRLNETETGNNGESAENISLLDLFGSAASQLSDHDRVRLDIGRACFELTASDSLGDTDYRVISLRDATGERQAGYLRDAYHRTQWIISFTPDGTITECNDGFLEAVGYTRDEVIGQHHRMFVDFEEVSTEEYRDFWARLNAGEVVQGTGFKRLKKDGTAVYLRASYMPITDDHGQVIKVTKTASDATEEVLQQRAEAEERAQRVRDQEMVVQHLATGMKRLAEGDYTVELTEHFPQDYRQLRYDFNDAVSALREADAVRVRSSQHQNDVVERLAEALEKLSRGVLTFKIDGDFPPEYDQLRIDFNGAIGRLREVMQSITDTAASLKAGSVEITQAADDLSKRTENQAATLQETAAALDEITVTVRQTAEGAKEANRMASETREEATQSGEVVENAVGAMDEIERSSSQISQIIGVIDDIAFQTNLLALNAGVEAARAGDAGRGFAVVAQEVRALAQRSSEAAKEIKDLISTSSEQVSRGVELVDKAGTALSDIVKRVENVSTLVSEISASAQEQSVSLAEVNSAINKMDQVTQQNAAMVEQSTASSHALAEASGTLMKRVEHFSIGNSTASTQSNELFDDAFGEVFETKNAANSHSGSSVQDQREAAQAYFAGVGGAAEKLDGADEDWEEF
ncbi:MAG: methyl-accepting chemotaxis protein [Pseudomonadota bacterium]